MSCTDRTLSLQLPNNELFEHSLSKSKEVYICKQIEKYNVRVTFRVTFRVENHKKDLTAKTTTRSVYTSVYLTLSVILSWKKATEMRKSRSQAKEIAIQLKINCAQKVNGCFIFISASHVNGLYIISAIGYLYIIPALIVTK